MMDPAADAEEREHLLEGSHDTRSAGARTKHPLESDVEHGDSSPSKPDPPSHDAAHHQARRRDALRLLIGAGGIYGAFLYYGSLQEDVFRFESPDGVKFKQAWFLQFLEALANVLVGHVGRLVTRGTPHLPKRQFFITGASQVCSKAFTSLALAHGLSFPVATLAKSGKMAPVMLGQLLLGGTSYTTREYVQVAAIIAGTAALSMGKKKGGPANSTTSGVVFILLSLVMDGVTGGIQKKLKADMNRVGLSPKPYDFMYYTNLSMMVVALCTSLLLGEFSVGWSFCLHHPAVMRLVLQFSVCSAIGQSFIFYTVAHFDPLVCSTVTTTRKIGSVLMSIVLKGHELSGQGWAGVSLAIGGILSEVQFKVMRTRQQQLKSKVSM